MKDPESETQGSPPIEPDGDITLSSSREASFHEEQDTTEVRMLTSDGGDRLLGRNNLGDYSLAEPKDSAPSKVEQNRTKPTPHPSITDTKKNRDSRE